MCEGLHEHLQKAAEKGKDKAKGEKHVVYLRWHEEKLEITGEVPSSTHASLPYPTPNCKSLYHIYQVERAV